MTTETVRTPAGFKNVEIQSEAIDITATLFTELGSEASFLANSSPGDTLLVAVLVGLLNNTEPPSSVLFTSTASTLWTYTSQVGPVVTVPYGDYTVYQFNVTITRALPQGDSGTNDALTAVTVQGRTIATRTIRITCPA